MTESGRYEEKSRTQQTYADKQAEIANMLTSLPNMTAFVRVAGQEHTITVKHSQPDGKRSPLANVMQTITQWNLEDGYIRDRDEVEEEIEERQQYEEPQQSAPEPAPKQSDKPKVGTPNLPTPRRRKLNS